MQRGDGVDGEDFRRLRDVGAHSAVLNCVEARSIRTIVFHFGPLDTKCAKKRREVRCELDADADVDNTDDTSWQ